MTESFTNDEKSSVLDSLSLNCSFVKNKIHKFTEGEEVLSRWSDGLLYLGIVLEIDYTKNRSLLRFEDSSEYWIKFKDIYKGPCKGSDIVCSVCTCGISDPPNEIVICDNCGVGYHQNCHTPPILSNTLLLDADWYCRQCVFAFTARKGGAVNKGTFAKIMQTMKQTLPYDLKLLTWDSQHKVNSQEIYCYCGGPGEWYINMLQCSQCKQWFHEACIQCLEKPLLFGDRFYKFICSVCNSGPEFLKRFSLSWLDAVHLVLFNLTILHNKTYFDIKRDILSFLEEHWDAMQLQGSVAKSDPSKRPAIVKEILDTNRTRFKCGREIKKSTSIWGLRSRVAPPGPKFNLGNGDVLAETSEQQSSTSSKGKKRKFGSDLETNSCRQQKTVSSQSHYNFTPTSPSDSLSTPEFSVKKIRERLRSALQSSPSSDATKQGHLPNNKTKGRKKLISKQATQQENCVSTEKLQTHTNVGKKKKGRPPRKLRRTSCARVSQVEMETSNNGGKEVSMGITLDSIIPPPPSFEGLNNPFRDKTQVTPSSVPQSGNKQTSIITDSDIKVRAQPNPPNGVVTKVGNASKMDKTENGKNCCKKFTVNGHEMECCKWKLYSDNTTSNGYCKRRRHKTVSKELAPSLRNYFKPNNGSGSNRKLKILASRLTNVGKLQYLVEWDTF